MVPETTTNPLHEAAGEAAVETSSDSAIAWALAEDEAADQRRLAEAAAAAARAQALDRAHALQAHEEEVRLLCRELSAHLSVVPQLLEQQPLERQRSADLSRRLSDAHGIKLKPHVNAALPPRPPTPEARQRLEARLSMYGLTERLVKGDGNCQFRALSDQLYRSPRLHAFVRECTVAQLRRDAGRYEAYVPGSFEEYCRAMARGGEWGDHITLQAAADYFGLRICVLTSYPEACFIEIEPSQAASSRTLYLSFWAEVHYNSLYPEDDPPPPLPSEKILGSRRLYNLLVGEGAPPSPKV